MSHSVRRLWTAATVLLMGCQSVPSTMTDFLAAARVEAPAAAADFRPRRSLALREADEFGRQSTDGEGAVDAPADSHFGSPSEAAERIARSVPDDEVDNVWAETTSDGGESEDNTADIAATAQEQPPLQAAQMTGAVTPPDRSAFRDLRDRILHRGPFKREEAAAPAEPRVAETETALPEPVAGSLQQIAARPEPAVSPHDAPDEPPFAAGRRDDFSSLVKESSPIVQVGHDEAPFDRLRPSRSHKLPLEAPTPFSTIAREEATAAARADHDSQQDSDRRDPLRGNPAEETGRGANDADEGLAGSLFDVFGIGGDRAGTPQAETPHPLRPASIAPLQRPPRDGDEETPTPSIDALAESLQTVHWQEELDRLTALLETQLVHQNPGESSIEQDYYVRQHVALRLLYLIGSRRPEALQAIPDCDPAQQEFWTELLWALSNIFDDEAMPDQAGRARETATRLRAALTHIAPLAGLRLTHTQFCRQINGFGSYSTYDRDEFSPGQSVLVYTEVENFTSQLNAEEEFVTTLRSTIRIHRGDATGEILFEENLPPTEDRCRSQRRDYFHSYRITLPPDLTPGPHVLTLTARDQNSQKLRMTSLNFLVR